ncbi:RT/endonuclease [Hexamita inflata]|uniref:RT/endonuclease n=1 Tax=Hexamita inflata TaxID=28002 RepID=A0AA86UTJ8_9EUKA|nr:RT/endonuclease [Hexamita inflata]
MVEDIDEIIDITITIDEDKTNETKQKKLKRFDENTLATVKELIKEFKYHKALELLDSFIKKDENKERVQIDPSVREKQLKKLFPLPKQTQLKLDFRPYQKQFFTFSENEIFEAICNLDTTKACGPCGISNKYIKDMRYNKHFIKCLKALYEELYNNPTKMSEILPMFEFKIALIPKEDKISKRPVCVQNSLCNVLNSIILKRKDLLPRKFCKEQHLFDKNSMQQCKLDARKLSKNSVVMKIDIQNAFNETQLETLLYGMETQLVPMQTQLYICGLIQAQNCLETASYNLIQGSNLSSLCFSYAVEPILEELKKKYRISCYADDIIIEIGQSSEKEVIDFATSLFSKYGFTINEKKCFSTANDNVITFDGINISSTENDPRLHTSKKLTQTAEEIYSLIEQLLERGLGRSQALGIFLVSLIPKINWALRIEDYVKETIQDYKRIDELMAQTFYLITNPRQFTEEDFMGEQHQITIQNFINIMSAPLNRNGFNCILPGRNFEITQKLNAAEQLQYKDLFVKLKEHNEQWVMARWKALKFQEIVFAITIFYYIEMGVRSRVQRLQWLQCRGSWVNHTRSGPGGVTATVFKLEMSRPRPLVRLVMLNSSQKDEPESLAARWLSTHGDARENGQCPTLGEDRRYLLDIATDCVGYWRQLQTPTVARVGRLLG